MPAIDQNWQLFGYDLSQALKSWQLAWQQCLWGDESPLKSQLDEIVEVHSIKDAEKELGYYQAGIKLEQTTFKSSQVSCKAILLQDSLILNKTLDVPLAAEGDLVEVMALEVVANSPFPSDDTGSGWRLIEKTESYLRVQLVIISLGTVMQELREMHQCHDALEYEVWAEVDNSIVVLDGFGAAPRKQRYRKSLYSMAAVVGYCLVMLILMSGLYSAGKYWQLTKVQAYYEAAEGNAANAVELRTRLTLVNNMLVAGNDLIATHYSPHVELKRLSTLLSDKSWLLDFTMDESRLRIQGRGNNVADELLHLTDEPAYLTVMETRDTSTLGSGSLQQFSFDITLAEKK